eukprot:3807273-Rhodomonas_salina.1
MPPVPSPTRPFQVKAAARRRGWVRAGLWQTERPGGPAPSRAILVRVVAPQAREVGERSVTMPSSCHSLSPARLVALALAVERLPGPGPGPVLAESSDSS